MEAICWNHRRNYVTAIEELQRKSVYLSKELRRATAGLAENCAWYHLLTRIESDISKNRHYKAETYY